jgi:hypothetical protein
METCWVAARLVRHYWPSDVTSSCHPEVEVCHSQFNIFKGFDSGGQPVICDRISRGDLTDATTAESYQYCIPSDDGLIFFLVGPESPPGEMCDVNVRVRWGPISSGLALVAAFEANKPYYAALSDEVDDGWCDAHLPLVRTFGSGLPPPPAAGCKFKAAIEVCTTIRWLTNGNRSNAWCMEARLEHHLPRRVSWAGWWLKPSTLLATAGRGYSGHDPYSLSIQSTAAKTWMFACSEVLLDSNWACAMYEAGVARVKLMGFETNNPLHDDHEGKGAHWHPAVRHLPLLSASGERIKMCRYSNGVDPTPHLYLDDVGRIDVSGSRDSRQLPAITQSGTSAAGGIWRLEAFGTFLQPSGALCILPIVSLQSERTIEHENGGFLHVRAGWSTVPRGRQFQLHTGHNGETDRGSGWGVEFLDAHSGSVSGSGGSCVVALRSTRCGGYLHVRKSAPSLAENEEGARKWEVFMLHDSNANRGSQWIMESVEGGRFIFQSRHMVGMYLHVRESFENLVASGRKEQVLQLSPHRESVGSVWKINTSHASFLSLMRHSYELSLNEEMTSMGTRSSCVVSVNRDAAPWINVKTEVDAEAGQMAICISRADDGLLIKPPLALSFDPSTGCISGTNSRIYDVS